MHLCLLLRLLNSINHIRTELILYDKIEQNMLIWEIQSPNMNGVILKLHKDLMNSLMMTNLTVNVKMNIHGLYSWILVGQWRDGASVRHIRLNVIRFYSQCTSLAITAGVICSLFLVKILSRGKTSPFDGHLLSYTIDLAWYDCFRIDKNFFADCFDRWK